MNSDPQVMEYFPKTLTVNESDEFLDKIIERISKKGYGFWAMEVKDGGQFAGYIGFNDATFPSYFTPCVEIAWRLTKDVWGKGYATEGAKACLKHGFEVIGFKEIYSFTSTLNKRSEKVMVKIGMKKMGEFNHPQVEPESPLRKHVLYRITREQYLSSSAFRDPH